MAMNEKQTDKQADDVRIVDGKAVALREPRSQSGRADRLNVWAFTGTLLGWVLLLLGQRVLMGEGAQGLAKTCTVASVLLILAALGQRIWAAVSATSERRTSAYAFAGLSATGVVGLVMYGATTEWGRDRLGVRPPATGESDDFANIMTVAWISLVVVSVVPTLLGEIARWSMVHAEKAESRRVIAAVVGGLSVAFALIYGSLFTYGASHKEEWSADFSFFRVSAPSESTFRMLESLEQPLAVRIYYPAFDDAGKKIERYFGDLNAKSGRLQVALHDRLMVPQVAKKDKVDNDGVVVLARGEVTETFEIGLQKGTRPPAKLRSLDGEFQKALLKVMRDKRTAYLTVGHGELNTDGGEPGKRSFKLLEEFIESQNYAVKPLGLKEGLAQKVPDNATVVLVMGPTEAFSEAEVASLRVYAQGGGSLFLALDPAGKIDLQPLASIAGLTWKSGPVLHDQEYYPLNRNEADKQHIIVGLFSSHAAVSTMSKLSPRGAAVLLSGSAALEKGNDDRLKIDFALKASSGAWIEQGGDWRFDNDTEKQGVINVGAAVSMPLAPAADDKANDRAKDKSKGKQDEEEGDEANDEANDGADDKKVDGGSPEMRVFVVGDADCFSDYFVSHTQFNPLLFADAFRWLGGEESFTGTTSSEEDMTIVHTKEGEQLWFFGVIFAVPSVVLGAGIWYTRRRRRSGKSTRGGESSAKSSDAVNTTDEGASDEDDDDEDTEKQEGRSA